MLGLKLVGPRDMLLVQSGRGPESSATGGKVGSRDSAVSKTGFFQPWYQSTLSAPRKSTVQALEIIHKPPSSEPSIQVLLLPPPPLLMMFSFFSSVTNDRRIPLSPSLLSASNTNDNRLRFVDYQLERVRVAMNFRFGDRCSKSEGWRDLSN